MSIQTAGEALRRGKVLELTFEGLRRSVEVHTVGYSKTGHAIIRAWDVSGDTSGRGGWKLMRLDEAADVVITDLASEAPRPHYKRSDRAIQRIMREL